MTTKPTNRQLLARALWLAFQASFPMGLGFLHSAQANSMTEERLSTAYPPSDGADGSLVIRTDYICGRMVKTTFAISADGKLTVAPERPSPHYQSWSSRYETGTELAEAAVKSFSP